MQCSVQFRCDRSCCTEVENLQSRISFATDAVARSKLAYSDSNETGAVSQSPRVFATASVSKRIPERKFYTSLQQLPSHLNWRLHIWNDLTTAPVANVSKTANPSLTPYLRRRRQGQPRDRVTAAPCLQEYQDFELMFYKSHISVATGSRLWSAAISGGN